MTSIDLNSILEPEFLLPLVKGYFEQISTDQLTMPAAGVNNFCDTEVTIAEMCTDIAQTLVSNALQVSNPLMDGLLVEGCEQETVTVRLGELINQVFASALGIPHKTCESVAKFSALMEQEVETRANVTISRVNDTDSFPKDPAVYVHGIMSTVDNLGEMVFHVRDCLKTHLTWSRRRRMALRRYPQQMEKPLFTGPGPVEDIKVVSSSVNVPTTTDAVAEILLKWCRDKDSTLQSSADTVREAAEDIVKTILQERHPPDNAQHDSCGEDPSSGLPPSIQQKVQKFFAWCSKKSSGDQSESCRHFCDFARTQFEKMMEQLEILFEHGDSGLLINLPQRPDSQMSLDEFYEILPGVPVTPRSDCSARSTSSRITVFKEEVAALDFDVIHGDVAELFTKLSQQSSERSYVMTFSRQLAGKIFDHLMPSGAYQIPSVPEDQHLSDGVISRSVSRVSAGSKMSPEVMYAMVESAVRRFLQLAQLWYQMYSRSDPEVFGAITDISKLLAAKQNPVEAGDSAHEHVEDEMESRGLFSPSPCENISSDDGCWDDSSCEDVNSSCEDPLCSDPFGGDLCTGLLPPFVNKSDKRLKRRSADADKLSKKLDTGQASEEVYCPPVALTSQTPVEPQSAQEHEEQDDVDIHKHVKDDDDDDVDLHEHVEDDDDDDDDDDDVDLHGLLEDSDDDLSLHGHVADNDEDDEDHREHVEGDNDADVGLHEHMEEEDADPHEHVEDDDVDPHEHVEDDDDVDPHEHVENNDVDPHEHVEGDNDDVNPHEHVENNDVDPHEHVEKDNDDVDSHEYVEEPLDEVDPHEHVDDNVDPRERVENNDVEPHVHVEDKDDDADPHEPVEDKAIDTHKRVEDKDDIDPYEHEDEDVDTRERVEEKDGVDPHEHVEDEDIDTHQHVEDKDGDVDPHVHGGLHHQEDRVDFHDNVCKDPGTGLSPPFVIESDKSLKSNLCDDESSETEEPCNKLDTEQLMDDVQSLLATLNRRTPLEPSGSTHEPEEGRDDAEPREHVKEDNDDKKSYTLCSTNPHGDISSCEDEDSSCEDGHLYRLSGLSSPRGLSSCDRLSLAATKRFCPSEPSTSASTDRQRSDRKHGHQSAHVEELRNKLAIEMTMNMLASLTHNRALKNEEFLPVIHRLSDVVEEINPSLILASKNKHISKSVVAAVTKDVIEEFDSPELAMEAAVLEDPFFDETVSESLITHLSSFKQEKPKKHNICAFFSTLGKKIRQLFCIRPQPSE